jgi:hypothetical protein
MRANIRHPLRARISHPLRERIPHPLRERFPRPLRERRHSRRRRSRPAAGSVQAGAPVSISDLAVQRVRDAGGPVDRASYSCECGYVFLAPVSTTVKCPHCEAGQAW